MQINRVFRVSLALVTVALLAACAHPISMEPSKLPEISASNLVQKKVGYVITDANRTKEVTTPGGGGDKVSYFPYRDLEKGIRTALRAVYQDVTSLTSATDLAAIDQAGVSYVFTPEITTTSSSPSPFTWPPTQFTAEVSCTVTDAKGAVVAKVMANGQGAAEFSEFKSDFSLSARRAAADVVEKLAVEIRREQKLH